MKGSNGLTIIVIIIVILIYQPRHNLWSLCSRVNRVFWLGLQCLAIKFFKWCYPQYLDLDCNLTLLVEFRRIVIIIIKLLQAGWTYYYLILVLIINIISSSSLVESFIRIRMKIFQDLGSTKAFQTLDLGKAGRLWEPGALCIVLIANFDTFSPSTGVKAWWARCLTSSLVAKKRIILKV